MQIRSSTPYPPFSWGYIDHIADALVIAYPDTDPTLQTSSTLGSLIEKLAPTSAPAQLPDTVYHEMIIDAWCERYGANSGASYDSR